MKICSQCDSVRDDEKFYAHSSMCKDCTKIYNKQYREQNKIKIDSYNKEYYQNNKEQCKESVKNWRLTNKDTVRAHQKKSIRQLSTRYKVAQRQTFKRGYSWNLSFEQFCDLVKLPCDYCAGFFGKCETGSGLDRKNNSIGYELDNVVSCCFTCNKIKNDTLTYEEAKMVISLIVSNRQNLNEI